MTNQSKRHGMTTINILQYIRRCCLFLHMYRGLSIYDLVLVDELGSSVGFDGAYTYYLLVPDKYIARIGSYLISVIAVHSQSWPRVPEGCTLPLHHLLTLSISLSLSIVWFLSCLAQVVAGISSSVSELVTVMSDTERQRELERKGDGYMQREVIESSL